MQSEVSMKDITLAACDIQRMQLRQCVIEKQQM